MQGESAMQDSLENDDQVLHASNMDVSLDELHLDQAHLPSLNGKANEFSDNHDPMQDDESDVFQEDGEEEIDPDDDWSEDDERPSQYDMRQYGVYQSLPIPRGPPNMESDCDTAEEYLRRVRYEAEQLPQTVTSHIDPRAYDAQRTCYVPVQKEEALTAAECIPSQQWLNEFLTDFAALRSQLHREDGERDPFLPKAPPPPPPHPLPLPRDKLGWQRYCLGTAAAANHAQSTVQGAQSDAMPDTAHSSATVITPQSVQETGITTDSDSGHVTAQAPAPDLQVAAASDDEENHNAAVLADEAADTSMQGIESRHQGAMEDLPETSAAMDTSQEAAVAGHPPQMAVLASLDQVFINHLLQWQVNWAIAASDLPDLSTRWLYALMAQVEKPIAVDSSSQLSKLLRHCLHLRKQICDSNDSRLLSLHMLIALAGSYFGQDGTLAAYMQPGWL